MLGYPPSDLIVRWVLRAISIPNINPIPIKKIVPILLNQAKTNRHRKRVVGSIKEAKDVKLKPVPKPDLRKHKTIGWDVENKPKYSNESKNTESCISENNTCHSCGFHIKNCPNCGSRFNEHLLKG